VLVLVLAAEWGTSILSTTSTLVHLVPQRFDVKMQDNLLPGVLASVSPLGQCSGEMTAGIEGTLMSHVSWGIPAYSSVSEASGYGGTVLLTSLAASQGCWRWPAFTRPYSHEIYETYPEQRAVLGWEIRPFHASFGYHTPKPNRGGSGGLELRHARLLSMLPPKSKFEHHNYIHVPAEATQASLLGCKARQSLLTSHQPRRTSTSTSTFGTAMSTKGNKSGAKGGNGGGGGITFKQFQQMAKFMGQRGNRQANRAQRRNQQSQNAKIRSIPRNILPRLERFVQGLPSTTNTVAVRGQGYYDAFVQHPETLVLASQVGPCTPVEGFTRYNIIGSGGVTDATYYANATVTTTVSDNTTLFVFNPGSSTDVVAKAYSLTANASNEAVVQETPCSVTAFGEFGPAITNHGHDGNHNVDADHQSTMSPGMRIESIPIRGSIRIRNITENYGIGGEIRIMRYNGGLLLGHDTVGNNQTSGALTPANYLDICDMLRDTKRALSLDGHEVKHPHQCNTYPADHVRSMTFQEDLSFHEVVRKPSYCSILVLVDNFKASQTQVNNSYSIAMTVQRAARFDPGTLLHSKSIVPDVNPIGHSQMSRGEALKPAAHALVKGAAHDILKAGANAATGRIAQKIGGAAAKQAGKLGLMGLEMMPFA